MLKEGNLLAALILASAYSEKYRGRNLDREAVADIKLSDDLGSCRATLLWRFGRREATPFIWLGTDEAENRTLYVAMSPIRNKRQYFKLLTQGSYMVDDVLQRDGEEHTIRISSYIKERLDGLWSAEHQSGIRHGSPDLGDALEQTAAEHPGCRILFCGISHGGALAQAAALRFALLHPGYSSRIHVVSWNAYKWTDASGAAIARSVLGDRLLPLVLSSREGNERTWDSVPEFPPGFSPMPGTVLLDVDSGGFFSGLQVGHATVGVDFAARLFQLHFAKSAIAAMKIAMERERTGTGQIARSRWHGARRLLSAMNFVLPEASAADAAAAGCGDHVLNLHDDIPDDSPDGGSTDGDIGGRSPTRSLEIRSQSWHEPLIRPSQA